MPRKSYQTDSEDEWPSDNSVGSVDLQKVISLPRIPGIKSNLVYQNNYCFSHIRSLQLARKKKKKSRKILQWYGTKDLLVVQPQKSLRVSMQL